MSAMLFRHEVTRTQQAQWLGAVRIARPPGFAWVTGVAAALALGLVAFAVLGQVERKANVSGILLPAEGLLQVSAPQAGVIERWLVKEGDAVGEGQPLVRIRSERHAEFGAASAVARVAVAQRRQSVRSELQLLESNARQRERAAAERSRSLAFEAQQLQAELSNTDERVRMARENQQRFRELADRGFVSAAQLQQKQDELHELLSRHHAARRNLQVIERELLQLKSERATHEISWRANQEPLKRALAGLDQEEAELELREGARVLAPKAGIVSSITRNLGHTVQAGQTLLSLVAARRPEPEASPDTRSGPSAGVELLGHLYAPPRKAGFIRPGQAVWMRYDAYPYQKFGMAEGVVAHVSDTPLPQEDLPPGQAGALFAANPAGEPLLRITVHLKQQTVGANGQRWQLKPGTTFEATVVQERRAVWEWLFEPLLAARERSRTLGTIPNATNPGR